jgi:hypothetical protein
MSEMTDDELAAELSRRRNTLIQKRKSEEVAEASEKRMRMLLELEEINLEIGESSSSSASSSSSSSSSSFEVSNPFKLTLAEKIAPQNNFAAGTTPAFYPRY